MAYPTTDLIDAIRTAATNIEDGEWSHRWGDPKSCNCGLVARALVGEEVDSPSGTWNDMGDYLERKPYIKEDVCRESGLTYGELYDTLTDAGLTDEDFEELEFLKNESVLKAMGRSKIEVDKYDAHDVIEYLRTWADLLETARTMIREESDVESADNTGDTDGPTLDELLQQVRNASQEEVTTALNKIGYDFN